MQSQGPKSFMVRRRRATARWSSVLITEVVWACSTQRRGVEHILTAIPGDAKLRQTENVDPGLAGLVHRRDDVSLILLPIEGSLVQRGRGNVD